MVIIFLRHFSQTLFMFLVLSEGPHVGLLISCSHEK